MLAERQLSFSAISWEKNRFPPLLASLIVLHHLLSGRGVVVVVSCPPLSRPQFDNSDLQDFRSQQCNVHLCIPVFSTLLNPESLSPVCKCFKHKDKGTLFLFFVLFCFSFKTQKYIIFSSVILAVP